MTIKSSQLSLIFVVQMFFVVNLFYGETPNWIELKEKYEIEKAKDLGNKPWRYNDIIVEIGRLGDPKAIPFLREVATQPMTTRTPVSTKYKDIAFYESDHGKAEVALVLLGDEEIFQRIVEHTINEDVFVRRSALKKLNAIGGERVIEPLANYIGDNDIVLEIESMRILREVKLLLYGEIPNWVELKDQYENAKANDLVNNPRRYNDIIVEIGRLGDLEAIPFLREVATEPIITYPTYLTRDKDIAIFDLNQGRAEVALVLLGDEEIFQRIVENTGHEDALVRYNALMKLKLIGGDRVIEPVASYIGDLTPVDGVRLEWESINILSELVPNPPWKYTSDEVFNFEEYKIGRKKWLEWKGQLFNAEQGRNTDSVSDSKKEMIKSDLDITEDSVTSLATTQSEGKEYLPEESENFLIVRIVLLFLAFGAVLLFIFNRRRDITVK